MSRIRNYIKESHHQEVDIILNTITQQLQEEGLSVEFGKIGVHTTYALIHNEDHTVEIIGYTFLKDMKYYRENVGNLRALQQAMARKEMINSEKK